MKSKKYLILGLIAGIILIGGSFILVDKAMAENNRPHDSIVQRLVERFGLNQDEVESVFEQEHQERQQQMTALREEKLNQAMTAGVITAEQKQALLDKQNQWREENQGQEPGERQNHQQEMQTWMAENGIDHEALSEYMGGFGPGGPKGRPVGHRGEAGLGQNKEE